MFIPFVIAAIIMRIVHTVLHETGHMIAAILLLEGTGERTMYLGSYSNRNGSIAFHIGRVEIVMKKNIFRWRGGSIVYPFSDVSIWRITVMLLAGPLFPLIISACLCCLAILGRWNYPLDLLAVTLFIYSVASLFINLFPRPNAIRGQDGQMTGNDGAHIIDLFQRRKYLPEMGAAIAHYREKRYAEAALLFEEIIRNNNAKKDIYHFAISACISNYDFNRAADIYHQLEQRFQPDATDFMTSGLIKSQSGRVEEGLKDYEHSLRLNPDNYLTLNNRGYALCQIERYAEAIADLDRAIELKPDFAYSYSNRGFARVHIGRLDEGESDIRRSIELDADNAYTYRNLGICHMHRNEHADALKLLEKARGMDHRTPMIDELIARAAGQITIG